VIENRGLQITQFQNYSIAQLIGFGTARAVRKDLAVSGRGLRGFCFAALSGAVIQGLVALETLTADGEISN
jgi:hypothetical protein